MNLDVKFLNLKELQDLAKDIRTFLVETVTETGGHLASNLGVVELTIAIHRVFSLERDVVIWDVGHQSYVHKILTGRKDKFSTLRQWNGISGFPKTNESKYDFFNTGHSGTSISAALGFAKSKELFKKSGQVVAVIGDASISEGISLEALNHLGSCGTKVIVILNDNGMSISKNVGAISKYLNIVRNDERYFRLKNDVKGLLTKVPFGEEIKSTIRNIKNCAKQVLITQKTFEDFGIKYCGPIDGHDIRALELALTEIVKLKEPVIFHVHTKKGKGYLPAEKNPESFHSVPKRDKIGDKRNCLVTRKEFKCADEKLSYKILNKSYSSIFGDALCSIAEGNNKVVAITAAMPEGTGLGEFSKRFSERFFDVGIAEQHAVTFSAGLAISGIIPVFAVYSSFLQRAYDQILHDVVLQNLHVVFAIDRAGIVGEDGETHHGLYDISYLLPMPGIELLAPESGDELALMLDYAINSAKGPIAIRYPKGFAVSSILIDECINHCEDACGNNFTCVKSRKQFTNSLNIVIIYTGALIPEVAKLSEILLKNRISYAIIKFGRLKPVDTTILKEFENFDLIVTIEDGIRIGGFGCFVQENFPKKILKIAYSDLVIQHGDVKMLKEYYDLSAEKIADKILSKLKDMDVKFSEPE